MRITGCTPCAHVLRTAPPITTAHPGEDAPRHSPEVTALPVGRVLMCTIGETGHTPSATQLWRRLQRSRLRSACVAGSASDCPAISRPRKPASPSTARGFRRLSSLSPHSALSDSHYAIQSSAKRFAEDRRAGGMLRPSDDAGKRTMTSAMPPHRDTVCQLIVADARGRMLRSEEPPARRQSARSTAPGTPTLSAPRLDGGPAATRGVELCG
jgi:hypothetical protein